MINLLEDIMFGMFAAAIFIWLLQIWKTDKQFERSEKIRSITFLIAFVLGFLLLTIANNIVGAVICLIGFVISEFTSAVVFYEHFRAKEVVNE